MKCKTIIRSMAIFLIASLPSLQAAEQQQTVTLEAVHVLASGVLDGTSNASVDVDFVDLDFTFDQFDSGLGILEDVRVTFSFTHSFSITASSLVTSDETDAFVAYYTANYGFSYTVGGLVFEGNGGGTGDGTNTANETLAGVLAFTDEPLVDESFFSLFEGAGTVTMQAKRTSAGGSLFNFQADGYFTEYNVQRDAGAMATLTYEYTPVPEPAAFAGVLGVVAASVAFRRRLL